MIVLCCVSGRELDHASYGLEEGEVVSTREHGEVTVGLDALSVNDLTLWKSKITEAISNNSAVEKNFLSKQKSGNVHQPYD